jgi:hypothetical protein
MTTKTRTLTVRLMVADLKRRMADARELETKA